MKFTRLTQAFATAHSCGLRRGCRESEQQARPLCHSAFVRVATRREVLQQCLTQPLPQRIRAGCDCGVLATSALLSLCHSAFVRVATSSAGSPFCAPPSLPQRIRAGCDSTARRPTPLCQLCHSAFVRVATAEKQCSALRICCEKVDSFSSVGESGLALTIFPFSFAAKATYVAINDSFGRAIDRFFGANRTGISVSYDFAEHPCL